MQIACCTQYSFNSLMKHFVPFYIFTIFSENFMDFLLSMLEISSVHRNHLRESRTCACTRCESAGLWIKIYGFLHYSCARCPPHLHQQFSIFSFHIFRQWITMMFYYYCAHLYMFIGMRLVYLRRNNHNFPSSSISRNCVAAIRPIRLLIQWNL